MRSVLILLLLVSVTAFGGEYSFVQMREGSDRVDEFFDRLGLADIKEDVECRQKVCYVSVINHEGKVLLGPFNTKNNSITIHGKGRYYKGAVALVERTMNISILVYKELYILHHDGRRVQLLPFLGFYLTLKLLPNGNILIVKKDKLVELSPEGEVFSMPLPMTLEYAYLGNNPSGLVALVGSGGNDLLFLEYRREDSRYIIDSQALTTYGDRKGILSIYPYAEGVSYSAIYRYVNEYNKGLMLYELNFKEGILLKGHLFNSDERNVGFDPSVYADEKSVVVSARNSTENKWVHFVVPKEELGKIAYGKPAHIQGFEYEKSTSFIVSARISLLTWNALSEVRKDDTAYAKVRYEMSNSIFYGASLEGRMGRTQIAVSYLQNRAEEKGGLTAKTSRLISGVIDVHGIFGRNILRIGYEEGLISGIARYEDVQNGTGREVVFDTRLRTIYGYVMQERGLYGGLEYLNYRIPSAVGYSDSSGALVYYDFDPNFTLNSFLLVLGYDEVKYAKRYETNFSRFYFAGNIGVGLGKAEVSAFIIDEAKRRASASEDSVPLYVVGKAYAELGYIIQRRSRAYKGLGFSFNAGYRLTGMIVGVDNDDSDSSQDKVYLEFQRYDLLHGPFLQANVIF